jgi:pimeloyl-ACP methyl ester carboxylesterase
VPTLVLWGEADTALPPRLLDGLGELVDDLTIERLPGATHWLAHEEPQRIASAIHAFCGAS